ncbi:MAG: response regulator transcription factor [Planctomycetes bacterium]|nr:response regulator transcription factor [Planctomycetota bacterium]
MTRILVAEDEPDMLMGLRENLQMEGYEVLEAVDGEAAVELATKERPDLILLDVMMPKLDGFAVCKRLREAGFTVPILMLTARGQEEDVVRGLELGADDYITKPFGVAELLARIKTSLRHAGARTGVSKMMTIGDTEIDLVSGQAVRGGETYRLGHFEIEIVKMLVENAEQPVDRRELLSKIWGLEAFPADRTVDNHIVSLRRKLEKDPKHPRHILTVHSIGYKFVP